MILQTLVVAFIVSYIGSIPPGTINISVMQLAILNKRKAAIFLTFIASAVEFIYAGISVQFHIVLASNEVIANYFNISASVILIGLGLLNIFSGLIPSLVKVSTKVDRRNDLVGGILLSVLNPMTIPFWISVTSYLENDNWVNVDGRYGFWMYLIGLASGTFCLLSTVNALGKRFINIADNKFITHKIPGFFLLALGGYFLLKLIL